jgi:hypothetical protein
MGQPKDMTPHDFLHETHSHWARVISSVFLPIGARLGSLPHTYQHRFFLFTFVSKLALANSI